MASIHTDRSRRVAQQKGAFSGRADNACLWDLSKRELVEIALQLASICADTDGSEEALQGTAARDRVLEERDLLKTAGLI